nr:Mariner Mos1 transposase [Hymenolepis microstoma]
MGNFTPPATVLSRCRSASFRSMAHGLADQHFSSYEEVKNWTHRLMDLIERGETFSPQKSSAAQEMGQSSGLRWTIL